VATAVALVTLWRNKQHKTITTIASSGCSICKGAATANSNSKINLKRSNNQPAVAMMAKAIIIATASRTEVAVKGAAKALTARAEQSH